MFRPDRSQRAGPYLEWKVRLFTVGAILALGGMYLDEGWVLAVATVVLILGMLVRFLPHPDGDVDAGGPEGPGDDAAGP
ncbi:MAG: hypothetical protein RJQ04_15275 [Longimicrobiales bacterium]